MNYKIANKDEMALIFEKNPNDLYVALASVVKDDKEKGTNSSFFFIPSDCDKVSCSVMQGKEKHVFMRLPISLIKDFSGCEGLTVPSENVIFYAVPLTCKENTIESVYMFCALQNNSGVNNSQLDESGIYRIAIHYRPAMNKIADKYYAENKK